MSLPAIRNNNAGNIEGNSINWQGKTGMDGNYVVFSSTMWGFRALYKDIYNKITNDGLNTLQDIFSRYLSVGEPPDNHTQQEADEYATNVSNYLDNISITDTIKPDETTLKAIAHGIAKQESGNDADYFTESDYNNGYLLFKGEQIATSPIGFFGMAVIIGGIWYLLNKKK